MTAMINDIIPAHATFRQVRSDGANLEHYQQLHPLEQAIVAGAVEQRKAEFGDARWCAHRAIEDLTGRPSVEPILRGRRGTPLWPRQVTGSMTHTDGLRAAVVAPRLKVRSIGVDAEVAEPLPAGVLGSVSRAGERARLGRTGISCPDRLLFCAKEATYKAWYPVTGRWLGFEDAEIDLRSDGTFTSYILLRPTPVHLIEGTWVVDDGYILAVASLT